MYTIISYRANGQVFRGGYCEGRTDSDLSIQTTESKTDAVELLAQAIYLDKVAQNANLNKDYDYTESAEIIFGIKGFFGSEHAADSIDDLVYDQDCDERSEMLHQAQLIASAKYSTRLNRDREEKQRIQQENSDAAARRAEAAERAQLAKLQAKYGVSNG